MAATFAWAGTYGAAPGTSLDLGASGNLFNFKNANSLADPSDYTTNPVTASNPSFEVWLRGHFTGDFSTVKNIQFWKSDGVADTGITIKWDGDGNTAYQTPVNTTSTLATVVIPTADPGTANVSIGGSLAGELSADGYSDYIILQIQTTVSAASGDSSLYVFTCQYDEQ